MNFKIIPISLILMMILLNGCSGGQEAIGEIGQTIIVETYSHEGGLIKRWSGEDITVYPTDKGIIIKQIDLLNNEMVTTEVIGGIIYITHHEPML